jgi:hypothetical protein
MTKKNKRSVRSVRPTSTYKSLNDQQENSEQEIKKDLMENPEEPTFEPTSEPVEEVLDQVTETPAETVQVDEDEEKYNTELSKDIPQYNLKPIPETPSPRTLNNHRKSSNNTVTMAQKSQSLLSLNNPIMRYGIMGLGAIIVIFVFMMFKKKKVVEGGPTIVEVKEKEDDEKKSVRNSINRISSPRIVFGDLRKNPSLMVAPPMTPAAK